MELFTEFSIHILIIKLDKELDLHKSHSIKIHDFMQQKFPYFIKARHQY